MNYKTYSSEGIILARRNFGEADRILILFTEDFGKISLIAKGARKLTSRKRGGIEIFNHIKFSAVKSRGIDILTEVQVVYSPDGVKNDLRKISIGYYFCEVVGKITSDEEKHLQVFELLHGYFEKLEISKNLKRLRLEFVNEILIEIGFWPKGKKMDNPDLVLESVMERKLNSSRVGRKMLQKD